MKKKKEIEVITKEKENFTKGKQEYESKKPELFKEIEQKVNEK